MMRCDLCECLVPDGVRLCTIHRKQYSEMRNALLMNLARDPNMAAAPDSVQETYIKGAMKLAQRAMNAIIAADISDASKDGIK